MYDMEDAVFAQVYRRLSEHAELLKDHILSGRISSQEEYRAMVGRYEMCQMLEQDVKDIERRFMAQD